jgi:hypothetical protein
VASSELLQSIPGPQVLNIISLPDASQTPGRRCNRQLRRSRMDRYGVAVGTRESARRLHSAAPLRQAVRGCQLCSVALLDVRVVHYRTDGAVLITTQQQLCSSRVAALTSQFLKIVIDGGNSIAEERSAL